MDKKRVLFIGESSFLATGFSTYLNEVIKRLHKTGEFEIFEMGSYAHADDPRCQQVPWKFYPVAPAKSDQKAMAEYAPNVAKHFGEGIFDEVCLDCKPDIVCVPPGTKIETPNGIKNIEDIKVGDRIISHTGKSRKVLKVMRKQYEGKVVKIYPYNDNECYAFTPEHPILTIQSKKRTWKQRDVQSRYNIEDARFVEAKELSKGDYVLIPIHRPNNQKSNIVEIDVTDCLDQFIYDAEDGKVYPTGHKNYKRDNGIPKNIAITKDFARLLGYYVAEGSSSCGKVSFSFGYEEIQYANDVKNMIKNIFDIPAKIHPRQDKGVRVVDTCSNILCKIMLSLCGKGAHNKKVPDCILQSNGIDLIESFLEGLIKGDGCYKPDTVSLCTVSETLARQVRMLFARLGIKASIASKLNKPTKLVKCERLLFDVECYGQFARMAHKFVNKHSKLSSRKSDNPKWIDKGSVGWIEDDYLVVPIRRIRTKTYNGQVYNLEVEKDNSYVTGFAVHNCGIRDWWMDEFVLRSASRHNFTFIWMPTIDGEPQRELWLDSYLQCDRILTYSHYGMDLLKKTARKNTKLVTIASPGSDLDMFKPPDDKKKHKASLGIDPNSFIIGTVMRNQKRKLYYDLIEAFSDWVYSSKTKGHIELARKTFLYLHTSYPDVGYDIGKAIRDFKIGNKVIMTYLCSECHTAYPSFFAGELMVCRKCGKLAAHTPNAEHSCPRNVLAGIMQTFDLYVQYSIAEGWGMPCTDALACGVPVAAVDYSAMQDHLRCPTSIPINVERFFWEAIIETEQRRALPDNRDFISKMDRFLKFSDEKRQEISRRTREYAVELVDTYGTDKKMPRYGWERTTEIWRNVIGETSVKDRKTTWLCNIPKIRKPNLVPPGTNMDNSEFVNWVIGKIWGRPEMLHTHFAGEWLKCLNSGARTMGDKRVPFDRNQLVNHFMGMVKQSNEVEQKRMNMLNSVAQDDINTVVM